jgi:hypothetical protein
MLGGAGIERGYRLARRGAPWMRSDPAFISHGIEPDKIAFVSLRQVRRERSAQHLLDIRT